MVYVKPRSFCVRINGREVYGITEISQPICNHVELTYEEDGRIETWIGRLFISDDLNVFRIRYDLQRAWLQKTEIPAETMCGKSIRIPYKR